MERKSIKNSAKDGWSENVPPGAGASTSGVAVFAIEQITYQPGIPLTFKKASLSLTEVSATQMILFHFVMQQLSGNANDFSGSGYIATGMDQRIHNGGFFAFDPDFRQTF
jgi:hypothetical protein